MATLHYYVDTASTSGGDGTTTAVTGANRAFATLNAANAALAQDLVTAGNSIVIHCDASTGVGDTTVVNFGTWTTDSTHYLTVQVDTAHRHSGIWNDSKYSIGGYNALSRPPSYTRFIGLQVHNTRADDLSVSLWYLSGRQGVQIHSCIGRFTDMNYTYGRNYHVDCGVDGTGDPTIVTNSLFYGAAGTHGANGSVGLRAVNTNVVAYNCTFIGPGPLAPADGIALSDGYSRVKAINCVVKGWANFGNPNTGGTDYNATDLAAASGHAHDRVSQAFAFTAPTANPPDYRLASTDTGAKGYGKDLSSDSSYAFSDDISGATRAAPWDIGASAVTAPAPQEDDAAASGTLTFGGSATATQQERASAMGALAFAGSGTATSAVNATATSTIALLGSATAVSTETVSVVASITFNGNATAAQGGPQATAGDTLAFDGTATATQQERATATGVLAFAGTATATLVGTAAAAGTITLLGSATAVSTETAAVVASITFSGSAAATQGGQQATATGTITLAGSAAALQQERATATGTIALLGSAIGTQQESATVNGGTISFGGYATAATASGAHAAGTLVFTGHATATGTVAGLAAGTLSLSGHATVAVAVSAAATGQLGLSGSASVVVVDAASASGPVSFGGYAAAAQRNNATAAGALTFGGVATAHPQAEGTVAASGAIVFTGSATATENGPIATGAGTFVFAGSGAGAVTVTAITSPIAFTFTGTSSATILDQAVVVGSLAFAGYGAVAVELRASAFAALIFGGEGTALTNAELIIFGEWLAMELQYLGAFTVEPQFAGTFAVEPQYLGAFTIGGAGTS